MKETHNETVTPYLSAEKIAAKVAEIAAEINRDFAGKQVTLLGTLKGATIFLADLARAVTVPVTLEFIKVSSYGGCSESTGEVRLDFPFQMDLKGQNVIIVEDIVDMGYTARWLREYLQSFDPAELRLCTLLDKPDRRKVPVKIDYAGFSIPDEFVVGYGLDFAQRYRNLPYVGILKG